MLMRRHPHRGRLLWLFFGVCAGLIAVSAYVVYQRLPDYRNAIQEQQERVGSAVLDRNGRILRLFPDGKGRMGLWCHTNVFPAHLKAAVIAAEDKRFNYHPGFDPIAIARALYSNTLKNKRISGASTITQQVVRLIRPRERTYSAKIVELLASVKMESQLSKEQILELHLNLSPMGGNIRGAALAARTYFSKDVENITLAEAAVLAALPRSPSRLDPRRSAGSKLVLAEKDRILKRMAALGTISDDQLKVSLGPTVAFKNRSIPVHAPHFVDLALTTHAETSATVQTTLDLSLQQGLEQILNSHRDRLRRMGIDQVAAIVTSCRTAEVLALVGSFSYSERYQGFNNGTLADRSAGFHPQAVPVRSGPRERLWGQLGDFRHRPRLSDPSRGLPAYERGPQRVRSGQCKVCSWQLAQRLRGESGSVGGSRRFLPAVRSGGSDHSVLRVA